MLALGIEKSWAIPVKIDRVKSSESKIEKGLVQFLDVLKNLPKKALKVLAADSLYSSNFSLKLTNKRMRLLSQERVVTEKLFINLQEFKKRKAEKENMEIR